MKLYVYKWVRTDSKWYQFWKPTHTLKKIGSINGKKVK